MNLLLHLVSSIRVDILMYPLPSHRAYQLCLLCRPCGWKWQEYMVASQLMLIQELSSCPRCRSGGSGGRSGQVCWSQIEDIGSSSCWEQKMSSSMRTGLFTTPSPSWNAGLWRRWTLARQDWPLISLAFSRWPRSRRSFLVIRPLCEMSTRSRTWRRWVQRCEYTNASSCRCFIEIKTYEWVITLFL